MAKYLIQDTTLTEIADAIREKMDTTDSFTPEDMVSAIESLSSLGVFEAIDSGVITIASTSNVTVDHNLGVVPDVVFMVLKDTWSASGSYSTGPRILSTNMFKKKYYAHSSADVTTYSLYTGVRITRYINSSEVAATSTGTFNTSTLSEYLTDTTFVFYNTSSYNKSAAADYVWFCGKFKEEYTPL